MIGRMTRLRIPAGLKVTPALQRQLSWAAGIGADNARAGYHKTIPCYNLRDISPQAVAERLAAGWAYRDGWNSVALPSNQL